MHVLNNGVCTTCPDVARHLPGLHDQKEHGRRFRIPGDPQSGLKKATKAVKGRPRKPKASPEPAAPKSPEVSKRRSFDEHAFTSALGGNAARKSLPYNYAKSHDLPDSAFNGTNASAVSYAVNDYGDNGYQYVNRVLRSTKGKPDFPDQLPGVLHYTPRRGKSIAEGLDAAFAMSKTTKPIVVSRGMVDTKMFEPYASGDLTGLEFVDHGYVSTSVKPNASAQFTSNGAGVAMRILVPPGVPAISSTGLDRDEILLGRGLRFAVVRDRTVNGVRNLDLEVVT